LSPTRLNPAATGTVLHLDQDYFGAQSARLGTDLLTLISNLTAELRALGEYQQAYDLDGMD
jgi:hypothetical protein